MDKNKMIALAEEFPEQIWLEAARSYLMWLEQKGALQKALEIYEQILDICGPNAAIASMCRYLIATFLASSDLETATRLYASFPASSNPDALAEKMLACNLISHALFAANPEESIGLWRAQIENLHSCALKWHWAQTGLLLIEECLENGAKDQAIGIRSLLHEYARCEQTKKALARADMLLG